MSSLERQTENQLSNIEKSTGRTVAEWSEIIRQSGLTKHGQLVAMLKEQYSLGHGNANLLVLKAREVATGGAPTGDALIDSHYAGKNAPLRPLYEAVVARIRDFGPDVELAPKKEYVSARRRKQFGQVGPAAGQLEICLNLPGKEPTERLRATSGMATHRVRIGDTKEIDDELVSWLREAYERA
jgi:predicted transport protein